MQSEEWAYRLSLREKKEKYFVYEFLFNESDTLKVKRFNSLNKEWLEFIKENRSKGGLQHGYDVVIGPVADDRTMETVQFYQSKTYKTLQNTENALWAESAEYIMDRYLEECRSA